MGFDIRAGEFWDEEALDHEMRRVFEICQSCRLCFNLCFSFPHLFELVDGREGELSRVESSSFRRVVELCFQCKLCYVRCPYAPPHEYGVDFPRLMLRARAVRATRHGVTFQDRALGDVALLGEVARRNAGLANWSMRNPLVRALIERTVGIHHQRNVPPFYGKPFVAWFARHRAHGGTPRGSNGNAALFYTCYVNYNDPEVGIACVQVLEHSEVAVACPDQVCCGMPFLDGGDLRRAMRNVEYNVKALSRMVEQGYDVVVPGPTCGYMLRKEYPLLMGSHDARRVASKTYDICEYLLRLHKEGRLNTDFKASVGRVAYHVPCHLRAQEVGVKAPALLGLIPDTEVEAVERCSGMDGTWGMKRQFFDMSLKIGSKLFQGVVEARAEALVTDCPLAELQIEKGAGKRPVHPVQVLQRAYGLSAEGTL